MPSKLSKAAEIDVAKARAASKLRAKPHGPVDPVEKAKSRAHVAKAKAKRTPEIVADAPAPETPVVNSRDRHEWLEAAREWCSRAMVKGGYEVPQNVRVSIGFTGSRHGKKAIGACWYPEAVSDGHHEVFIGPHIKDPVEIVGVVMHELIHVVAGQEAKHGPKFREIALKLGLEGKMTATVVSDGLREVIEGRFLAHHPYPAGMINVAMRKKQTTRLLKVACPHCGYTARTTAKWIDAAGPPICPIHNTEPMELV